MSYKRKLVKEARRHGWTIEQYDYIEHCRVKVLDGNNVLYDVSETEYCINPYQKILWQIKRDKGPDVKIVYSPPQMLRTPPEF